MDSYTEDRAAGLVDGFYQSAEDVGPVPTHKLAKIILDPDVQVIAQFDYARRLAASLHAAGGCRVIVKEGDKDFKMLIWGTPEDITT